MMVLSQDDKHNKQVLVVNENYQTFPLSNSAPLIFTSFRRMESNIKIAIGNTSGAIFAFMLAMQGKLMSLHAYCG